LPRDVRADQFITAPQGPRPITAYDTHVPLRDHRMLDGVGEMPASSGGSPRNPLRRSCDSPTTVFASRPLADQQLASKKKKAAATTRKKFSPAREVFGKNPPQTLIANAIGSFGTVCVKSFDDFEDSNRAEVASR
jgi:hypothetical protein